MSRLTDTKKVMATQRVINNQIFFFEWPVGQTKIIKKKKIDPLIEAVGGFIFNMMDCIVTCYGVNYKLGPTALHVFHAIAKGHGEVVSEPDIFDQVWGHCKRYRQGDVSDVVRRIKEKMGDIVCLEYGKGYYLNINHGRIIAKKPLQVA